MTEKFFRAKLTLEEVQPYTNKYDNLSEHTTEISAHTVTGATPADAMVQMCAHADSLYGWHQVEADDTADDLLYDAWALIANAGWDAHRGLVDLEKSPGWHEAAIRWRDRYHARLGTDQPEHDERSARVEAAVAVGNTLIGLLRHIQADVEAVKAKSSDRPERPTVVVLCGSTRFSEAFREANLRETLAGRIVLSIGCDMRSDAEVFAGYDEGELAIVKTNLDELHKRKIDLADEVLVLNVGGYIGDSTRSEIAYAQKRGKPIRWLEEPLAAKACPCDQFCPDGERCDGLTTQEAVAQLNAEQRAEGVSVRQDDTDQPLRHPFEDAVLREEDKKLLYQGDPPVEVEGEPDGLDRATTEPPHDVAAGIDPYAIPANRIEQ